MSNNRADGRSWLLWSFVLLGACAGGCNRTAAEQKRLVGAWGWGGEDISQSLTFDAEGGVRFRQRFRANRSEEKGTYRVVSPGTVAFTWQDGGEERYEYAFEDGDSRLVLEGFRKGADSARVWHRQGGSGAAPPEDEARRAEEEERAERERKREEK